MELPRHLGPPPHPRGTLTLRVTLVRDHGRRDENPAVPVVDRIVRSPEGDEFVIEAWRPLDPAAGPLGLLLTIVHPWWVIGVKRFPVSFGSRAIYVERTVGAGATQRRVDELARHIGAGRLPRRR